MVGGHRLTCIVLLFDSRPQFWNTPNQLCCTMHFLCASTRPLASIICTPRSSWPGLPLKSLPYPALLLWPILFGKQCPAVNAVHQQQQQQRNRTRSIVWHHHRGSDFLPPWSPPSSDMASETEIYYKKEEPPTTQCISGPRNLQWRFRLFMILFAPPNTTTHHHSSLLLDMNPAFRPFQQSVVGRTTTFSSAAIHHRLHSHFYQRSTFFNRFTPPLRRAPGNREYFDGLLEQEVLLKK